VGFHTNAAQRQEIPMKLTTTQHAAVQYWVRTKQLAAVALWVSQDINNSIPKGGKVRDWMSEEEAKAFEGVSDTDLLRYLKNLRPNRSHPAEQARKRQYVKGPTTRLLTIS
jgi:hypothetical protein